MESLLLRPAPLPPRPFSTAFSRGSSIRLNYSVGKTCTGSFICSSGKVHQCINSNLGHVSGRSAYHGRSRELIRVNASEHSLGEPQEYDSLSFWKPILSLLNAFYRFSRPHTIIGTALSIVSVSLLAVQNLSDFSPLFLTGLLEAIVPALFMNIYIVGLNQVFDIEIDKINKPTLPLASGEYSLRTGVAIISTFAVLSFAGGCLVGSWPLFWALFISFILGTAYSINMPFLRWKRSAVVAALCILAVRAVIVQLAFFLHMQTFVFRRPATFSRPLIFATAFMTFFSVVIALFKHLGSLLIFSICLQPFGSRSEGQHISVVRWILTSEIVGFAFLILKSRILFTIMLLDIPDIEGDRIFGIQSFSVRLGQKKVFWICVFLLEMAYTVALVIGATSSCLWSKFATVLGHAVLASVLWNRARSLDLRSKAAITSFYMFIWKLFYAEYLLIPLVR